MLELKRVFNLKMMSVIIAAVFVNMCLFFYGQLQGKSITQFLNQNHQYIMAINQYENKDINDALEDITNDYTNILYYERSNIVDEEKYESNTIQYSDNENLDKYKDLPDDQKKSYLSQLIIIKNKLNYLNEYHSNINSVLENAELMKKSNLFSQQSSYSYNNILKTTQDFTRVENLYLVLDNDRGTDAFVHYYYIYYIAAALMLGIIYSLFKERENGMWKLTHSMYRGRVYLGIERLFILLLSSFFILGVLYLSTFLLSFLIYGGWSSLQNSIQTISDFSKFVNIMSKGQYLLTLFLLSWLTLCALSIILWMLFTINRNRTNTLLCVTVFIGIEIVLFKSISIQSNLNSLHFLNIVNLLKISDLYSTYLNWGTGNIIFSVMSLLYFVLVTSALVCACIAVLCFSDMRPEEKNNTQVTNILNWFNVRYQNIFTHYPIVLKEMHKLIFSSKGKWIILAALVITIYSSSTGIMAFTDQEKEYDNMYIMHGGKDVTYITEYVQSKLDDYLQMEERVQNIKQQYEAGEIQLAEYASAQQALQYQASGLQLIREYQTKLQYVQHIKDTYNKDAWLISDRGYEEIFGTLSNQRELILLLILIISIMLLVSECITIEYRTGMKQIIYSCCNGRSWILKRKIASCCLYSIAMTLMIYAIDLIYMKKSYGMPYLNAPAISLSFLENMPFNLALNITIYQLIIIKIICHIMIALLTMFVALFISKLVGKNGNRAIMPVSLIIIIIIISFLHKFFYFFI